MRCADRMSTVTCLIFFAALLQPGRGQDLSNNNNGTGVNESLTSPTGSPLPSFVRRARSSLNRSNRPCLAPPQPANGEWRLSEDFCEDGIVDCKVPEGTQLGLGYQLVYSCATGYKVDGNNGSNLVYCRPNQQWSIIPVCKEIQCPPLKEVSGFANCYLNGGKVDCESPVPPKTTAAIYCKPGYWKKPAVLGHDDIPECDKTGKWKPEPVWCQPVCGQKADSQSVVFGGSKTDSGDIPWHASIYVERKSSNGLKKELLCGATIIQDNFVMTAAHCVYNKTTGVTEDPQRLFVMTGNSFRDYDYPMHDFKFVKKVGVKKVNLPLEFYELIENYDSDIALLELEDPLLFSESLLPACWDASSLGAPVLEKGVFGSVAFFETQATTNSSTTLQSTTVPYVPNNECKIRDDKAKDYISIAKDKFCAGYTNGSAVCSGDSGGGITFRIKDQWYVLGIMSTGFDGEFNNGERTCEKHPLKLYTKVSEYADWIREVISDPKQIKPDREAEIEWHIVTTSPASTSTLPPPRTETFPTPWLMPVRPSGSSVTCVSPRQPNNGKWRLHPTPCINDNGSKTKCDVGPGVKLESGTALVYSCNVGYKVKANTNVFCTRLGSWSDSPECVVDREVVTVKTPTTVVPDTVQDKIEDLPWYSSFYEVKNTSLGLRKEFRCGASIIESNLLLTARHCVHDEKTGATLDSSKLFVMTGNTNSDYDSPLHDPKIVKKTAVKTVHVNCWYTGLKGNLHASETALLQLEESLQSTAIHSPECKGVSGHSQPVIDIDVTRKISVFRTSTRGSVVCYHNPNGETVINENEVWHVLGVASVDPGPDCDNIGSKCQKRPQNLYMRISDNTPWILEVIS